VGKPTIAGRTRTVLLGVVDALDDPTTRWTLLGGGVLLSVALYAALGDPRLSWIAAPLALIAGLAAGVRTAMAVAITAAIAYLIIDVAVIGVTGTDAIGIAVRTIMLPGLALVGSAGADLEAQRTRALQRSVSEDPVTGLLNVRVFYEELAQLREAGTAFTILLADIRGMRALNERYGHPTGTEAMRALAHVLRRAAGTQVMACRLGSDEVAVALIGEDRDRCREIVDQVMARLEQEQVGLPDGNRFEVHAAYGIARYPEDGTDEVAVLRAADRAKERAKAAGLDRVGTADGDVA
jgi:diguanylate cyclase (GGDEF)-like protein